MLTHNESYSQKVAFKVGGGFRFWGKENTDGVTYTLKDKSVFLPRRGKDVKCKNCTLPEDIKEYLENNDLDYEQIIGYMILKRALLNR